MRWGRADAWTSVHVFGFAGLPDQFEDQSFAHHERAVFEDAFGHSPELRRQVVEQGPGEDRVRTYHLAERRLGKPRRARRFERDHACRPRLAVDAGQFAEDLARINVAI